MLGTKLHLALENDNNVVGINIVYSGQCYQGLNGEYVLIQLIYIS